MPTTPTRRRRTSRTGTLLLLAARAAALSLAGRATLAPAINVTAPGFGGSATGVVQLWDRSTTSPFGKLLVNRFNATYKNLKVILMAVQDTQYVTKLATAIRDSLSAIAIPHFQWDNSDGRAVRMWMPQVPAAATTAEAPQRGG